MTTDVERGVWRIWLRVIWGQRPGETEWHAYVGWRLLCGRPFTDAMRDHHNVPLARDRCVESEREARRRVA